MKTVLYTAKDRVARIALNRPRQLNAINIDLLSEFDLALEQANLDNEIDIIFISGEGSSFSSGDDLDELGSSVPSAVEVEANIERLQDITRHIMLSPKIVVCAAQGWAIGAGASWLLNADYTVWSEGVRLKFPEARVGLFPSGGVTYLLEKFCGPQRAFDILLRGETLTMERLLSDRIAAEFVAAVDLQASCEALIDELLTLGPETLARYKAARRLSVGPGLEHALDCEAMQMKKAVLAMIKLRAAVVPG